MFFNYKMTVQYTDASYFLCYGRGAPTETRRGGGPRGDDHGGGGGGVAAEGGGEVPDIPEAGQEHQDPPGVPAVVGAGVWCGGGGDVVTVENPLST